jgi:hypothetical protein
MSVTNGQKANQTTFNNAFVSRTVDTDTAGKVTLKRAAGSGAQVTDTQLAINQLEAATGADEVNSGTNYGAPASTIADGDTHKVALKKLADKFHAATGHTHSGAAGDGAPIPAANVSAVPLAPYYVESPAKVGITGTSIDVSADLSGYTESTASNVPGIVTGSPNNKAFIRRSGGADDGKPIFAAGREVYGKVTKAGAVWTLSFYTNIAGVETVYSFLAASDFKYYPLQLASPLGTPLVYPNLAKTLIDAGGAGGASGGGAAVQWIEQANSPTPDVDNGDRIYLFDKAAAQELWALIKVPESYVAGAVIKLHTYWYTYVADGLDGRLETQSTLIRTGTDAMTTTAHQRTGGPGNLSTAGAGIPKANEFALTDLAGQIASTAVSPGDLIRVRLYRGTDTTLEQLRVPAFGAEVTFA